MELGKTGTAWYMYIELREETRADLREVKKLLMSKPGLTKDPLVAGKEFICTNTTEIRDCKYFAENLKLLFSHYRGTCICNFATEIFDGIVTILKGQLQ